MNEGADALPLTSTETVVLTGRAGPMRVHVHRPRDGHAGWAIIAHGRNGAADAPHMDFVLTVCDKAAGEICPVWPGQPMSAHWGVEDPASVKGGEDVIQRAFNDAFMVLSRRVALLTVLPIEKLDRLALNKELAGIGQVRA